MGKKFGEIVHCVILGPERVHKFQGREPSGRAGDDISLDSNQKPHNPLVNSGAILSTAMILHEVKPENGCDIAAKYDFVFNFFKVILKIARFFF